MQRFRALSDTIAGHDATLNLPLSAGSEASAGNWVKTVHVKGKNESSLHLLPAVEFFLWYLKIYSPKNMFLTSLEGLLTRGNYAPQPLQ